MSAFEYRCPMTRMHQLCRPDGGEGAPRQAFFVWRSKT